MGEEITLKEETSKWKLTVSIGDNPPILLLNNEIAITHFDSDTRQLFETKEGSFIYFKDTIVLHKINEEKYSKLLLKLIEFQKEIEELEELKYFKKLCH